MVYNSSFRQIQQADSDNNGVLSQEEYQGTEEDFDRIDANKDEEITTQELTEDYFSQNPQAQRAREAIEAYKNLSNLFNSLLDLTV